MMSSSWRAALPLLVLASCRAPCPSAPASSTEAEPAMKAPAPAAVAKLPSTHAELVELFHDWREFEEPPLHEGAPDYRAERFDAAEADYQALRARLDQMKIDDWPVPEQVDWHLVRAEMNGYEFNQRVLQPWARDPAFYQSIWMGRSDVPAHEGPTHHAVVEFWTYSLPLSAEEQARLVRELGVIPPLMKQAQANLTGNARDLWVAGIRDIEAQGRHLDTIEEQTAQTADAELKAAIAAARSATEELLSWLEQQAPSKDGPSGLGRDEYTWYQRQVHYLPMSWEQEVDLLQRELDRAWASLETAVKPLYRLGQTQHIFSRGHVQVGQDLRHRLGEHALRVELVLLKLVHGLAEAFRTHELIGERIEITLPLRYPFTERRARVRRVAVCHVPLFRRQFSQQFTRPRPGVSLQTPVASGSARATIRAMKIRHLICSVIAIAALCTQGLAAADNPRVSIVTDYGAIEVELLEKLAPRTVTNFLQLVDDKFYDGLVFHRVIANFMIQGGGYTPDLTHKPGPGTVPNESMNGVKNTRGTLAMARLADPDSADTQFFINVKDNTHLDPGGDRAGYTVFGRVIGGMEVVDKIELVNTHLSRGMAAVPEEPVVIQKIERL